VYTACLQFVYKSAVYTTVYTAVYTVYTAVYEPCTRPCAHTGHVHGRMYTVVYTARTRPCRVHVYTTVYVFRGRELILV